jgi:hypothetical protein
VTNIADDPEVLKAWIAECERRYQDFLDGKTKAIPADKAFVQIRRQLAESKGTPKW